MIAHGSPRRFVRNVSLALLARRTRGWAPQDAGGSVIVFSPHYDDETLGAGGAIIKLRDSGVPVWLVFMTDGSASHAHAMDRAALSALRRQEALRAATVLGVDAGRVRFLEFPEKQLNQHRSEACARVVQVLKEACCDCVFVPAAMEPLLWSADHQETTAIVIKALAQTGMRPHILEYAVWFWYHWPWVPVLGNGDPRRLLRLSWANGFGVRSWLNFNAALDISDVSSRKRQALEQYRSQMTRLRRDKPWPVLEDVAGGEFLRNFFGPREYFRIYRYSGAPA